MSTTEAAARARRHDAQHPTPRPRRTVTIRGQAVPAPYIPPDREVTRPDARRRPSRSLHERAGARPDRIAGWAFVLGIALILVAALSGIH